MPLNDAFYDFAESLTEKVGAGVVGQLVGWSLPTPVNLGSNPINFSEHSSECKLLKDESQRERGRDWRIFEKNWRCWHRKLNKPWRCGQSDCLNNGT